MQALLIKLRDTHRDNLAVMARLDALQARIGSYGDCLCGYFFVVMQAP
jgi:hypothetical protein